MKEKHLWKVVTLFIAMLMGLAMIVSCSKDDGDATPPENPYKDGYYPDQKVSSNPTAYGFVDMSERSYIELFDGKYYMDHTKGEGGYLYYLVSQEENYHIWVNYEYGVAFLIDPYEVGRYRQLKECDGSIKATEYKDLYRIYHFDNAKKYPNINPVIVPATIDATVVMHLDQDAEYPRTNNSGGSSYDNDYDDEYPEGAKACYSCKGTLVCTACNGTGKGVGYSGDCVACEGTGICRFCDGKGYYFPLNGGGSSSGGNSSGGSSNNDNKGKKCTVCNGSGKCSRGNLLAEWCNGTGICGHCNGKGFAKYNGVTGKCHMCNGSGKCDWCNGTGKCDACNGTGYK